MGDAFGTSLARTPRTGLSDAISNLMYQSIFGGIANSGDPKFDAFIRAFTQGQGGGGGPTFDPGNPLGPINVPPPGGGGTPGFDLFNFFANAGGEPDPNNPGQTLPAGPTVPNTPSNPPGGEPDPNNPGQTLPPIGGGTPGAPGGGAPAEGPGGFRLGDFIQQMFSLPQYRGLMTAGMNPQQQTALQGASAAAGQFFPQQGGISDQIISQLLGQGQQGQGGAPYAPQDITSLLNRLPGQDILSQIAQGGGPGGNVLQQLTQPQDVGQNLLRQLAGQSPFDQSALFNLQNLAQGGGQQDYQTLFNAISQGQQGAFNRNLRDIREQYSAGGNRFSSGLANAFSQAGTENAQNIGSLLAQLGLQSAGSQNATRLGAASQLGQLGLGARGQTGDILSQLVNANLAGQGQQLNAGQILQQLGLGASSTLGQQGTGAADILSQLFSGQQGRSLSALQSLPGAQQTLSQLPLQFAQGLFGLGEGARGIQDTALQRQLAEFQRTQGALYPGIANYAAGAPIIASPGIGTQALGAGAALGGAALGAKPK